jgi:hypothetical protein
MSRTTRRIVLVILLLLAALAFMGIRAANAQVVPGPRGNPIVDQRSYARPQPRQAQPPPAYRPAPNPAPQSGYRRSPYVGSHNRHPNANRYGGHYNGSRGSRYHDRRSYGYGHNRYRYGRGYAYDYGYGYSGYGGYYGFGMPYMAPRTCWVPGQYVWDPLTGLPIYLAGYLAPCGW